MQIEIEPGKVSACSFFFWGRIKLYQTYSLELVST